MKSFITRFIKAYFDPALDLRVRLFNVLVIGGMVICCLMGILGILNSAGIFNTGLVLATAALSFALLIYLRRTGRYDVCYIITVIVVFFVVFPAMFFSSGGYKGGMPAFFVLAVAFTVFMLEGKKAILFSVAELLIYIAACLVAYFRPVTVNEFAEEWEELADIVSAFVVVSIVLGTSMFLHFRLYNANQRKLDEQNDLLAKASQAKTEFLANASHEMRTPLTIISVNVQTVIEILEDMSFIDTSSEDLLRNAQGEVMRLARMVGGMLTLASMSENVERQSVDFSTLAQGSTDMLRLNIQRRGNTFETDIEPCLKTFGNADLLAQVISNLLQNAGAHTTGGVISFTAEGSGSEIVVTVCDNGSGISPELLPYIFERGVSDGGTGFGLYLCKTVVESHGGRIWLDSEQGEGTKAVFTLPVYEGQFGGGEGGGNI